MNLFDLVVAQNIVGGGGGGGGITEAPFNDVNFYDYDGTRLFSYTKAEFLALASMPTTSVEHQYLVQDGWNWDLSNAKEFVTTYGALDIGMTYDTVDKGAYFSIFIPELRRSPSVIIRVKGKVIIDWGDGNTDEIIGDSSWSQDITTNHTYLVSGRYIIKINIDDTVPDSKFTFTSQVIRDLTTFSPVYDSDTDFVYVGSNAALNSTMLSKGEKYATLANNMDWYNNLTQFCQNSYKLQFFVFPRFKSGGTIGGSQSFQECTSLRGISFSQDTTPIRANSTLFKNCKSLNRVIGIGDLYQQTIDTETFYSCSNLYQIILLNDITTINNYGIYNCSSLQKIILPSTLTSIKQYAFASTKLKEIHFKSTTPPQVQASNAFSQLPEDCTIYVPTGYKDAYTSATNYPSSATYTYVEE